MQSTHCCSCVLQRQPSAERASAAVEAPAARRTSGPFVVPEDLADILGGGGAESDQPFKEASVSRLGFCAAYETGDLIECLATALDRLMQVSTAFDKVSHHTAPAVQPSPVLGLLSIMLGWWPHVTTFMALPHACPCPGRQLLLLAASVSLQLAAADLAPLAWPTSLCPAQMLVQSTQHLTPLSVAACHPWPCHQSAVLHHRLAT